MKFIGNKFIYGDTVKNHEFKSGIIRGIRFTQLDVFQEDKYMISYLIDPTPLLESDDEFWESEVNLIKQ